MSSSLRAAFLKFPSSYFRLPLIMVKCLPVQSFLLLFTVLVGLVDHVASMCPSKCTCADDKLSVSCKEASLDFVPITLNPDTRELFLSQNRIKTISESFSFYKNLKFLDLSSNQLSSLGRRHFTAQGGLQYLLLNRNRLTSVEFDSLTGLSSLTLLNLSENLIEHIADRVFFSLKSLEKLDLSNNLITSVSTSAFAGLRSLKLLSLRNNKLTKVPSDSLKPLTTLFKLDLASNPVESIQESAFESCSSLVDLRLDKCSLKTVSNNFLSGLKSLRWLHLDSNQMSTLTSDLFVTATRLESLVLSNNKLTFLSASVFSPLSSLKRLDLRSNQLLSVIDEDAFKGLHNLSRLLLDLTPSLHYLPDNLFKDSRASLRELTLRGSGVEVIQEKLLNWDQFKLLDVRDIPLACNCSSSWLWRYLRTANFMNKQHSQHVLCASPKHLAGREFLTLKKIQLSCNENIDIRVFLSFIIVALLLVALVGAVVIKFRHKMPLFWMRQEKLNRQIREEEDLISEKRRILENQVIFPPPSPYHPSCSLIYVRPPTRAAPISQV